jgi:predicted O-methyltransferase YrrM
MSVRTISLDDTLHAYLLKVGTRMDDIKLRLRAETEAMPQGRMQISAEQGQFMSLLMRLLNVKKAIEVGTFTGYSALCVAEALPSDGVLICCDVSDEFTRVGKPYWEEAGVATKIDLRLAPGAETLEKLLQEGHAGTVDFMFLDADKPSYDTYYEYALKLLRPGGLIGVDNALWSGYVANPEINDEDTVALRELNFKIHADPRVEMCLLPLGDGLMLAMKK